MKKRHLLRLFVLDLLVLSALGFVSAVDITGCGTLSTPNVQYDLTGDIIVNSSLCLSISAAASNITIDGHGHIMKTNNTDTARYGVFFNNGGTNATVKNIVLEGYNLPVYTASYNSIVADNLTIQNTNGRIIPNNPLFYSYKNSTFNNVSFCYGTTLHALNWSNILINNSWFNNTALFQFDWSNNIRIINTTNVANSIYFVNSSYLTFDNNYDLDYLFFSNSSYVNYTNNLINNAYRMILNTALDVTGHSNYIIDNNIVATSNISTATNLFYLPYIYNSEINNNQFGNSTNYLNITNSSNNLINIRAGDNLTIYNNSAYTNSSNVLYLRGSTDVHSSNIMIDSNNINFDTENPSYGLTCGTDGLSGSIKGGYITNCTMRNNNITAPYDSIGKHMVLLKFASNSSVYNNRVINGGYNFVIKDSNNVRVYDNYIVNGTSGNLHVKGTSNSFFYGNTFGQDSRGNLLYIWWDNAESIPCLNNSY